MFSLLTVLLVGGFTLRVLAGQSRNMGDDSAVVGMVDGAGGLSLALVFVIICLLLLLSL